MISNFELQIVTILLYSILGTMAAIIYFEEKVKKYGYMVEDKYKKDKRKIPTMGGIPMFVGVILSLSLSQLLVHEFNVGSLFIFYFIVTVYTLYGIVDDLFSFKQRYDKILILLVLSLPIGSLISQSYVDIFGYSINLGWLYAAAFAPVFIMVVANLVNVYSGFNGLATGLTLIMFIFAGIKSFMIYGWVNLMYLVPCLGALIVMYLYNRFPAKFHEGNSGAFMIGSCLGAFMIVNHMEVFGIIMLIPHTINFILDTLILAILRIPDEKFGKIREDGTIEAPKAVRFKSLKFIATYYLRLKEDQAVFLLYVPTIVFGMLGLWLG
jgi:UDP-N-acetylglucosamine--dolichyl-phosphate N-acetylglucosaminephosphotransferase